MSADEIKLSRDELKLLVREVVEEVVEEMLWKIEQQSPDPDMGLEFRPEVADHLRQALTVKKRGRALDDIMNEVMLANDHS